MNSGESNTQTQNLAELPTEVLSIVSQLLSPPFYPPPVPSSRDNSPSSSRRTASAHSYVRDVSIGREGGIFRTSSTGRGSGRDGRDSKGGGSGYIPTLDPQPPSTLSTLSQISQVSKTCHTLLEASRPWLWENIDIKSGRGWLAVVNALTEEVQENRDDGDEENDDGEAGAEMGQEGGGDRKGKGKFKMKSEPVGSVNTPIDGLPTNSTSSIFTFSSPFPSAHSSSQPVSAEVDNNEYVVMQAVSPQEAHMAPMSISSGYSGFRNPNGPPSYPSPYASSSAATHTIPYLNQNQSSYSNFTYSPPQPARVQDLLTPSTSRNSSPHFYFSESSTSGPTQTAQPAQSTQATAVPSGATESGLGLSGVAGVAGSAGAAGGGSGSGPSSQVRSSSILRAQSPGGISASTTSKLRGRSRSPRRSIGFATDGNSDILSRGRSTSSKRPSNLFERRSSFDNTRRTSLSRSRTRADISPTSSSEDENTPNLPMENRLSSEEKEERRRPTSLRRTSSNTYSREGSSRSPHPPIKEEEDNLHRDDNDGEGETEMERGRGRGVTVSMLGIEADLSRRHIGYTDGGRSGEEPQEENWLNVNPELLPPPGPYIRHLSFTNFRTIGSRRTQDEAVRGRFVTAGRLEGVIKNAPNLVTLCMTEYVDSALSYDVIEELFFRGTKREKSRNARKLSSRRRSSLSQSRSRARNRSLSVDPTTTDTVDDINHDQLDPPRPEYAPYEDETEDEKWKRRGMFTSLQALDLTGCVSRGFQEGMKDFWETYYTFPEMDKGKSRIDGNVNRDGGDFEMESGVESDRQRGRGRGRTRTRGNVTETENETEDEQHDHETTRGRTLGESKKRRIPIFPNMKRLSLRACFGIESRILDDFLQSFTNLTHLDLSNTKVSSTFLSHLTESPPKSLKLRSLSLARCPRIDPYVLVDFLCRSPVVRDLIELNLFVNPTQGNPIRSDHLLMLIKESPCFKSGNLQYLDLSSAMFTPEHFLPGIWSPQPSLISLGLSHIPRLSLSPIKDFLINVAPNVEILTLTGTAMESELKPSNPPLQITLELHAKLINPCTTVPFSLSSLYLDNSRNGSNGSNGSNGRRMEDDNKIYEPGPTKLRVIELSSIIRKAIGPEGVSGSNDWKVIKSKGGRGWYVDITASWQRILKPPKPKSPFASRSPSRDRSNLKYGNENEGKLDEAGTEEEEDDEMIWDFRRHLKKDNDSRKWLTFLSDANGRVSSGVGWHSRKMEVVRGWGMLGREEGLAGAGAFAFEE